jgi:hypothetical protein
MLCDKLILRTDAANAGSGTGSRCRSAPTFL